MEKALNAFVLTYGCFNFLYVELKAKTHFQPEFAIFGKGILEAVFNQLFFIEFGPAFENDVFS